MTNHHIHAALARERSSTFLAEAETARRARQARSRRRRAGPPGARRSLLGRLPRWPRPGWSRLPESNTAANAGVVRCLQLEFATITRRADPYPPHPPAGQTHIRGEF